MLNSVVPVPKIQGKIVKRRINDTVYMEYETGRIYDRDRQYNIPERVRIGIQIPERPGLMLANKNYRIYFPKEEETMNEEAKEQVESYNQEREHRFMLRDLFDQLYYEFRTLSRKNPEGVVNENKVRRINRILEPMAEMMKEKEYARFLELIPEPEEKETREGESVLTGMSYGDVALLLTQFKAAMTRYFQENRS